MWETEFANRLYKLRSGKGVSARDMSLSLGQSPGYINRIENKKTLPSMTSFLYICEYLGVTPQEFFDTRLESPRRLAEALGELRKLSAPELEHITSLLKDLNAHKWPSSQG